MLKITFHPDSGNPVLVRATRQYQNIWRKEGNRIVKAMERISGLRFAEKWLSAIVFEGVSHSHPLSLRASYTEEEKRAALIHELCHRLLAGNGVQVKAPNSEARGLKVHKYVNLILYDIWVVLYGEKFAKRNVKVESKRRSLYKKAWKWALAFDKETRSKKLSKLIEIARGIRRRY